MGFQELPEGQVITAAFKSITVFEARGIMLESGAVEAANGSCAGVAYRIAASASVNAACQALLSDSYSDDEEEWKNKRKCSGPFILISVGPTDEYTCHFGWIRSEADGSITTHDAFPALRGELSRREDLILPRLRSALTCVMNESDQYVALRKIENTRVGLTKEGVTVRNIRIDFHAEGYASFKLDQNVLRDRLSKSIRLADTLSPKASGLFALGLDETDEFKKFMCFFLALEVETHAVFGKIDQAASLQRMVHGSAILRNSIVQLLERQSKTLSNLFDRFVWCATFSWSNVTDADVDQFRALKNARDNIAHGTTSHPPPGFARMAEKLAHKVFWQPK